MEPRHCRLPLRSPHGFLLDWASWGPAWDERLPDIWKFPRTSPPKLRALAVPLPSRQDGGLLETRCRTEKTSVHLVAGIAWPWGNQGAQP